MIGGYKGPKIGLDDCTHALASSEIVTKDRTIPGIELNQTWVSHLNFTRPLISVTVNF